MDPAFVSREQDRMLRELTEFLSIPSVSAYPDHAADCRRAAEWLMQELPAARLSGTLRWSRDRAIRWSGPRARGSRVARRCSSTGTTTCSRPIPSMNGPRRRSSRRSRREALRARRLPTTRARCTACSRPTSRSLDADGNPPLNVHFIFEGEEECGGQRHLRSPAGRAGAHAGRRRAGLRHVVLRSRMAGRVHRAARPVLRRDLGAHAPA